LAIREKLAANFPMVPNYRQALAGSYNNLAVALEKLNQSDKAEAAYRQAIIVLEKLASDFPKVLAYAAELAGSYYNLGDLMQKSKQPDFALDWLSKSIKTAEPIVLRDPRLVKARRTLVLARWARAQAHWKARRLADAVNDWDRAVELDDGRHATELRLLRAFTLTGLADHARAAADAEAVAKAPKASADDLFKAACVLAKSAELSQDHPSLSEEYAARAVAVLRQAVGRGFRDPVMLRRVSELNYVRTRADFQKVQKELEEVKGH
jgi:tetratricopeptide (TPR) repeat protein